MLSTDPIKSRIGKLAIGLAVDCDAPANGIGQLLNEKLPGARTLPFVGVLTYDGQWVDGYSGFKQPAELTTFLEAVAKSPLLEAKPAVRKQLAGHLKIAKEAAAKSKWGTVSKTVAKAGALFGRCPERVAIDALGKQADDWLETRFAAVTEAAVNGDKLTDARKMLKEVRRVFSGQPEAELAARGSKALGRLMRVRSIEARGNPKANLRATAAKEFKGTRWTKLFDKPTK